MPGPEEYACTVVHRNGYLHITVTGTNSPDNVRRSLRDVIAACTQHGCSRVLLQEHFSGPSLGTVDVFEIVSEASRNAWPAVAQIAYVDTNPQHDSNLLDFAETVAINRGVQIRLCATVADAEGWLMGLAA
jgi:hypothetical protein